MLKVYTHENGFIVGNARNILERAGIPCTLRNEYASSGIGDLSPLETWPELWVLDDADYERAVQLLEDTFAAHSPRWHWYCPHCGELNAPAFELCWQCGTEAPDLAR